MISGEHDEAEERQALASGACAFLHKPFYSTDVDRVLHDIYGIRSPNLTLERSEPDFDVAVEGSTIRLAHKGSGHTFEYLWFKHPPYLRNGTVRPGPYRDPRSRAAHGGGREERIASAEYRQAAHGGLEGC